MIRMFRASDRATYAHNVVLTFTARRSVTIFADPAIRDAVIAFCQATDNYGMDKIRGVAIEDSRVTLVVAIPPNRSVAQVAPRLKTCASTCLLRQFPALADRLSGRGAWQRGYSMETLGAQSIAWIAGYLAGKEKAHA